MPGRKLGQEEPETILTPRLTSTQAQQQNSGAFPAQVPQPFYRNYLSLDLASTSGLCNIYWSINFSPVPSRKGINHVS